MKNSACKIWFIFCVLCTTLNSFSQRNYQEMPDVVYMGQFTLQSPIIINKDDIGYITNGSNINTNLKKIFDKRDAFIVIAEFHDKCIYEFFYDIAFGCNGPTLRYLEKEGLHNPIEPKFTYSETKNGCEVYRTDATVLNCLVFLAQVEFLNRLLNPEVDFMYKTKVKKRKFDARYPKNEYVKVLFPIGDSE